MAEVTSQDFQKLLEEQKKTTKALDKVSMLQKENVDVGKDNLKQGELFGPQTEEQSKQTTKVEELKDVNKSYFQQIIDKISSLFKSIPSISLRMSQKKSEQSFLTSLFKPFEGLKKDLVGTFDFLTNKKGGLFDFGGFLGKTKLLALLAALPFFLDSELFGKMLGNIDTVLGLLPALNEKFKPLGDLIDRIGEGLGIDGLTDILQNIAIASAGLAVFFPKFRKRLIGFINTLINPFSKKFFLRRIFRFLGLGGDDFKKVAKGNKVKGGFLKQIGGFFGKLFKGMGSTLIKNFGLIMKGVFTGLRVGLLGIPLIGTIISLGLALIEGLLKGIKTFLEGGTLKESLFAFVEGFKDSILFLITLPVKLINKFFPDFLPDLKESIIEKFNKFIKEPFVNAFNKTVEDVGNFFSKPINGIVDIVKTQMIIFSEIKESISKGIDDFVGFFRGIGDDIESFRSKFSINTLDVFNKIKSGIEEIDEFLQSIRNLFKAIALGGKAAFKALRPGGKTPQEAFAETFEKVMNTGNANDIAASSETGGSADAMNENALNKMEGGQTTVVTTASIDNSNNSKVESNIHNMKQISHGDPTQLAVANAQ